MDLSSRLESVNELVQKDHLTELGSLEAVGYKIFGEIVFVLGDGGPMPLLV
jgi:hypothetical protein